MEYQRDFQIEIGHCQDAKNQFNPSLESYQKALQFADELCEKVPNSLRDKEDMEKEKADVMVYIGQQLASLQKPLWLNEAKQKLNESTKIYKELQKTPL